MSNLNQMLDASKFYQKQSFTSPSRRHAAENPGGSFMLNMGLQWIFTVTSLILKMGHFKSAFWIYSYNGPNMGLLHTLGLFARAYLVTKISSTPWARKYGPTARAPWTALVTD